jgi:hypothetical protein
VEDLLPQAGALLDGWAELPPHEIRDKPRRAASPDVTAGTITYEPEKAPKNQAIAGAAAIEDGSVDAVFKEPLLTEPRLIWISKHNDSAHVKRKLYWYRKTQNFRAFGLDAHPFT